MTRYIALDLETTGFSTEFDEIIEIGAWKVVDDVTVDKYQSFIRPAKYIPRTVQNITGITMQDVDSAEPVDFVLPEFFGWCEDFNFVGHNLPFDFGFLLVKGKNLGIDFSLDGQRMGIDTLEIARRLYPGKSHKLEDLVSMYGIDLGTDHKFHRALEDAMFTRLVYQRLRMYYPQGTTDPSPIDKEDKKYGKVTNNAVLDFK